MAFQTRRAKRLQREIGILLSTTKEDTDCGICIELPDDSIMENLIAYIQGPPDTPYESGLYQLSIEFSPEYPLTAPKITFITRIWHPNISSVTGTICLDTLSTQWTPSLSVYTCLISIRALLASPQPNDPQDAMVATQYMNCYRDYVITAKYWTNEFAAKNPNYYKPKKVINSKKTTSPTPPQTSARSTSSDTSVTRPNLFTAPVPSAQTNQMPSSKDTKSNEKAVPLIPEKTDDERLLEYKALHEKVIAYHIPRTKALEVLTLQNWDLAKTLEELNITDETNSSKISKRPKPTRKRSRT